MYRACYANYIGCACRYLFRFFKPLKLLILAFDVICLRSAHNLSVNFDKSQNMDLVLSLRTGVLLSGAYYDCLATGLARSGPTKSLAEYILVVRLFQPA